MMVLSQRYEETDSEVSEDRKFKRMGSSEER
jgi:hypothetical protein